MGFYTRAISQRNSEWRESYSREIGAGKEAETEERRSRVGKKRNKRERQRGGGGVVDGEMKSENYSEGDE